MPVRTRGGGSTATVEPGTAQADVRWIEDATVNDTAGIIWANLESAEVADAIGLFSPQLPEEVQVNDPWRLTNRARLTEDANADDFSRTRLATLTYARSATPDADGSGDSAVRQDQSAVNFGADTTMTAKTAGVSDERRGLLFFDFTRFADLTATGGTHSFRLTVSHGTIATSNSLRVRFSTLTAKPFTESTVTWANQPAEGTLVLSTTILATTTVLPYNVALTDAHINSFLGKWVYVRLLSEAALATTIFTISSRESGVTTAPAFTFTVRR